MRLINFIIGYNNGGKDTISTAILIYLGGKPTSVDYEDSLKHFIRGLESKL